MRSFLLIILSNRDKIKPMAFTPYRQPLSKEESYNKTYAVLTIYTCNSNTAEDLLFKGLEGILYSSFHRPSSEHQQLVPAQKHYQFQLVHMRDFLFLFLFLSRFEVVD